MYVLRIEQKLFNFSNFSNFYSVNTEDSLRLVIFFLTLDRWLTFNIILISNHILKVKHRVETVRWNVSVFYWVITFYNYKKMTNLIVLIIKLINQCPVTLYGHNPSKLSTRLFYLYLTATIHVYIHTHAPLSFMINISFFIGSLLKTYYGINVI